MKKLTFAGLLLIVSIGISASGQVKPGLTASNHTRSITAGAPTVSAATRARVIARSTSATSNQEIAKLGSQRNSELDPTITSAVPYRSVKATWSNATVDPMPISSRPRTSRTTNTNLATSAAAPVLTNIYRIGVGDVLDVQLLNNPTNKSTLYTVLDGGVIDYPLANGPIAVAGLTSGEVAARLRQQIKIFETPAVVVNVRDYASHSVTVSGLVGAPGVKVLRREAVPLFVVLSQSMPLAEATRATITRPNSFPIKTELADATGSGTLVLPGDVIKVTAGPVEFFFAGGEINAPGQKPYHASLTLTQAILASGGLSNNAGAKVKLSRQNENGRLVTTEYNLRNIQSGKAADPVLQKGDSLQVDSRR